MRSPTQLIAKIYYIRASVNVGERIALPQFIKNTFFDNLSGKLVPEAVPSDSFPTLSFRRLCRPGDAEGFI
jgi:hypothetical protein